MIPQQELCVTEACAGQDSWRKGYLKQSLPGGYSYSRTDSKAGGVWGRNMSVSFFSCLCGMAFQKVNEAGIVFRESPGTWGK